VFFPVFPDGRLPPELTRGSDAPSDALWWVFERLGQSVEHDPDRADEIRAVLDPLEASLAKEGMAGHRRLQALSGSEAEAFASEVMERVTARVSREVRQLLAQVGST
jgi:hypothetical protein